MSDAPEALWVELDHSGPAAKVWVGGDVRHLPKYIRADIHAARIAKLEAQIVYMAAAWGDDALHVEELTRQLAEARDHAMEDAAARLHLLWNADGTKGERRVVTDCIKAIRAMKGAKP